MLSKLKLKIKVSRKMAYEGTGMRWWPLYWTSGNRPENGYKLARLFDLDFLDRWHFQILMAHYPEGAKQELHRDRFKNMDIYRAVLVLKKSGTGGDLVGDRIIKLGRLYLMRPDLNQHEVTEVKDGERYSLLFSLYKRQLSDVEIEEIED
jgi:hypothetical protein